MSVVREHDLEPRAQARFEIVESNRGRIRRGTIRCLINHHIAIDAEALSSYCFKTLSPRIDDLVLITASVAFADRTLVRHPAQTWRRSIELVIPVNELGYWQHSSVQGELTDLLQLLTGDTWALNFRQRQAPTATRKQPPLGLSLSSRPIVMPFSDGLDSLAGARLIASAEPKATLILVTAGHRNDADQQWRVRHLNANRYRLVLPFKFQKSQSGHRLREMSYRSRALIYGTMAAIAAHLSGGERVIYTESGQGTLGPWLVPVGNEAPDIRMNPLFTTRLAGFLATVLGTPIRFEHPRMWATKGETMRELAEIGRADDWHQTRSCARDARHMTADGRLQQCGVCAGCLLRRQSLRAAGLDERLEQFAYFWNDLEASSLSAATQHRERATTTDDYRHAICGFLALAQLADLADAPADDLSVFSRQLAAAMHEDEQPINMNLRRLVKAHRSEWMTFLDKTGSASFLSEWARQRQ